LFKLTYSFDLLKQAIESLASNQDFRDENLHDFFNQFHQAMNDQDREVRHDYKKDIDQLRKDLEARIGGINVSAPASESKGANDFDASDLERQLEELRQ